MKASKKYEELALEYHRESERLLPRALLFGLLLLLSHLLEIRPSELDAGGIKIAVKDVTVVHGALSLVFLYYLWMCSLAGMTGASMMRLPGEQGTIRWLMGAARAPFRDPKTKRRTRRTPRQAKRRFRFLYAAYQLFLLPFVLVLAGILLIALPVALADTWTFGSYLLDRYDATQGVEVNGREPARPLVAQQFS